MAEEIVIARGFQGEPKRLVARGAADGRVLVGIASENADDQSVDNVVALPRSDVFEWEPEVFRRLTIEWNGTGGTDPQTWAALRPWGSRVHA